MIKEYVRLKEYSFCPNAACDKVVIRDDKSNYRVICVDDWIIDDESLDGTKGY